MPLSAGARLGAYQVIGPLGAGGMGEVWLARDPRLEREVALKVLPEEFARDPARMARFRSEALALAAVNHPNIATVYGFEESTDGRAMLVLEQVPGETLAAALRRGPFPVPEALRVGAGIAEALEAAHRRRVVHRDLKPANVMLGPNGMVKVLDFGLARSPSLPVAGSGSVAPPLPDAGALACASDTPTAVTPDEFEAGEISGTPGYMSPEQVRGEPQDERTDVFAFGCVLYECLTGRRAFPGATAHETYAAILAAAPDWSLLPPPTPARVRELLARCLAGAVADRPAAMRDVRHALEDSLGIRRASALRAGETAPGAPNNLPRPATSFVGRESALAECEALFRAARLLTVTGVGGAGKTRLALRLAERLLGEFPDGAWFVDLGPLGDPELVPHAVAVAAGVGEEPGRPVEQTLAAALAARRTLLVLDNCEHLLGACAALATGLLAAAPELRVLATSRESLGVRGEQTFSVPSLSLPGGDAWADPERAGEAEAPRLFVERARLVAPGFTLAKESAPVVAEICRRLDGIPLAIELAAARVRMLSVEEIRTRLGDRFRLLAGGSRTALPRHQTLRAAIRWSYDLLLPEEQRLLRALSVFTGGWTLEAAVAVCGDGADEFAVLDLLTRLEGKSMLVVDRPDERETRYRFLDTVRQYGREAAFERGEGDALRAAHRGWFLAFAERGAAQITGPEQGAWLDRMEREIDNLRSALDACLETAGAFEEAVRLGAALQWLWVIRGYIREGRERLEAVAVRAEDATRTPALAAVLQGAGNMCFRLDDYAAARRWYERGLSLREEIGDRRGIAGSLGALGNLAQYEGRFADAIVLFERSLAINREVGNRVWEATNLNCLGNCHRYMHELAAARGYLEQAVVLNREIGNRNGEAFSLDGLGGVLLDLREPAAARAVFERALAIERELRNDHEVAAILTNLARIATEEGDLRLARERFAEATASFRRLGSGRQLAGCVDSLAALLALEGDPVAAVRLWSAAEAAFEAFGVRADVERRPDERAALDALRGSLPRPDFEAAWEAGARLSVDEALAEGLAPRAGRARD